MMNKGWKIDGLKELSDALKGLPVELQAKILQAFIRKAGTKFVVNQLKTTLNYSSKLESTIKVVSDPKNKLAVSAGVTSDGYKLRFVDKGTVERQTKKGSKRGRITGKKQIEPTVLNSVEPIIKYTQEELGNEIEKNLQRRLKKIRKI